jgi:hypothetical protein
MQSEAEKELTQKFSSLLGTYGTPPVLQALVDVVRHIDFVSLPSGEIRKIFWENIVDFAEGQACYSMWVEDTRDEDDFDDEDDE